MGRRKGARALVLVAVLTVASPRLVSAQSPAQIAQAKLWFAEGVSLEDREKWSEALIFFRRASAVKMTPQLAFHLGLCEGRSGAFVEALASLERASELARAANVPTVDSAAKDEAAFVRSRMPTLEISVRPGDKLTRLSIDGQHVAVAAVSAPRPMNPGDHEVVAEFPSGTVKRAITVHLKEAARMPLDAPPGPSVVPLVLISAGGAGVVGGIIFYGLARSRIGFLDARCTSGRVCDSSRSELLNAVDSGKAYSTLSATLLTLGVVAAVTGGGLLIFGQKTAGPNAQLSPTASGAAITGRF